MASTSASSSTVATGLSVPLHVAATSVQMAIRVVLVSTSRRRGAPSWAAAAAKTGDPVASALRRLMMVLPTPTRALPDDLLARLAPSLTTPLDASELGGAAGLKALDLLARAPGYLIESQSGWHSICLRASLMGHVDLLDWWLKRHMAVPSTRAFPPYDSTVIDAASANGHVAVLEWWRTCGLPFPECTSYPINVASANGHVHVLDWWFQHSRRTRKPKAGRLAEQHTTAPRRLHFKHTARAMDDASANGHVDVLTWWWEHAVHVDQELRIKAIVTQRPRWWAQQHWPVVSCEWWDNPEHVEWMMPTWDLPQPVGAGDIGFAG